MAIMSGLAVRVRARVPWRWAAREGHAGGSWPRALPSWYHSGPEHGGHAGSSRARRSRARYVGGPRRWRRGRSEGGAKKKREWPWTSPQPDAARWSEVALALVERASWSPPLQCCRPRKPLLPPGKESPQPSAPPLLWTCEKGTRGNFVISHIISD